MKMIYSRDLVFSCNQKIQYIIKLHSLVLADFNNSYNFGVWQQQIMRYSVYVE